MIKRRDFLKGLVGMGAASLISFNEAKADEAEGGIAHPIEKFEPDEPLSADRLNEIVDRVNFQPNDSTGFIAGSTFTQVHHPAYWGLSTATASTNINVQEILKGV